MGSARRSLLKRLTVNGLGLVCACCALGASPPAAAQVRLGPAAGLTSYKLGGDGPEDASYGRRSGASFGLVGEAYLARDIVLSIQPGYVQRGTNVAVEVNDESQDSLRARLDYIDVGLFLKVLPDAGPLYFASGLDIGYLSGATIENAHGDPQERDIADLFDDFDFSMAFGVGVRLPISRTELALELRYTQSLTNIARDDTGLVALGMPARLRSSGLQLLAAWLFTVRR